MAQPLDGIRVLDFTWLQQGPFATVMLADMGAEIIKVEHREGERGRATGRGLPEPVPYFVAHDRGKRSVTLDVRRPEARDILERFIRKVDVVVSNMRPGAMKRLGLGYDDVAAINPRVVYAAGSAFGPLGPRATTPGNDVIGQAAGGIMTRNGPPDSPPGAVGAAIADQTGAILLCTGILAALVKRERTGVGEQVDVSLYGGQIALQSWEIDTVSMSGQQAPKTDLGHPLVTPRAVWRKFETADGWVAVGGAATDKFASLCELAGLPELAATYPDDRSRAGAMDVIQPRLEEAFRTKPSAYWLEGFKRYDIFGGPVQSYAEIIEDEQARVNGYIATMEHPHLGPVRVAGSPIQFGREPVTEVPPPPELGDHTEIYLTELGYSWDEITALREAEVI